MRLPLALLSAAGLLSTSLVGLSAVNASAAVVPEAASAAPSVALDARLQPWLATELAKGGTDTMQVMVSGTSTDAARAAATTAGLEIQQVWDKVAIVVAKGAPAAIRAVLPLPGVRYVEGDQPLEYKLDTAHQATRSDQALTTYKTASGQRIDGAGVTIAVIDSGIDGTHPMFTKDGQSKVVANLKNVCGITFDDSTNEDCFQQDPTNDTDTKSGGGHGTHVSGIAAGFEVETASPAGTKLRGAAPGAKLVGLSVGAAIGLLDANAAMFWVTEHQRRPCAPASEQDDADIDATCPPIRATNHSYGPVATEGEDQEYDENSATVTLQRELISQGVTPVWAAGNDGGDGSFAATNPPAMDPTPGVLMVASYDDAQSGARDNQLSSFSSRGKDDRPGSFPDVSAPGDLITSACRPSLAVCQGSPSFDGGNYQTISGTSMATPYTAGVVAQLAQAKPGITPAETEELLEDTAHKFTAGATYEEDPRNADDTTSFDKGHGLVDVLAVLASVQGAAAPAEPVPAAAAVSCGGLDLVTDPSGDAAAPVSGADAGSSQDITALSFEASSDMLTVSLDVANYNSVSAPGTSSTIYVASWTAPNGKKYGVSHQNAGGGYTVGEYEGGNSFKEDSTFAITGQERNGPEGGITFVVPRDKVGSPTIPVSAAADAAVQGPVAEVFGGVGSGGTGGLTFTAVIDRAPDGGDGPSWSVCKASGGVPNSGGDTTEPPAASPSPSGTASPRPTGPPTTGPAPSGSPGSTSSPSSSGSPSSTPSASGSSTPSASGSPSTSGSPSASGSPAASGSPGSGSGGSVEDTVQGQVFTRTSPVRVLDSRDATGTTKGRKQGDVELNLDRAIPTSAKAVVLNVTVTNPSAKGFVVAYPDGQSTPETSNVNFVANQTQANEVIVTVPESRKVILRVDSAQAHVIADLVGYAGDQQVDGAGTAVSLAAPERVLDTRDNAAKRVTGEVKVDLAGKVPAGANAAFLNVTLTQATKRGFAVVYPSGSTKPGTSNVNTEPGQTQANEVLSRIGSDGKVSVFVDSTTASVVVDLVGYVTTQPATASALVSLATPQRAVDTRTGEGMSKGQKSGEALMTMPPAVPDNATAVLLNVTATRGSKPGFVTAYAAGGNNPGTSNVNFGKNVNQANEVLTRIGSDRQVTLFVGGANTPAADLVVDVVGYLAPSSSGGGASPASAAMQTWLADELETAPADKPLRVFVHGATPAGARSAAQASGLKVVEVFDKVAVAVAVGLPAQVRDVRTQPGVTYVEGDMPVVPLLDTSHVATRGAEAVNTLTGTDGSKLDGTGVSIAVIDSGIDGTHPFFRGPDGKSKVVRNVKSGCLFLQFTQNDTCFVDVPGNDSDTPSLGGHGTHVAGIAAGYPTKLVNGKTVQGAAPGAKLIGLSVGQAVSVYGGNTGLNWVLDHHAAPCGAGVSATTCPPIRVTNNSYGVGGGSDFDPNSVTVKLQRALLNEGVLTVWAAGNDGGDGSGSSQTTNGPGMDPTGGILMVASYDDGGTGNRDAALSTFSSRGVRGTTDSYPDISAPGDTILSSCRPALAICNSSATIPVSGPGPLDVATFNTISGTSMAAPHIAGIVAQLLEGAPSASPGAVENAIENGAHRFTAGGAYETDPKNGGSQTSFDKGHGLVDVVAAANLLGIS